MEEDGTVCAIEERGTKRKRQETGCTKGERLSLSLGLAMGSNEELWKTERENEHVARNFLVRMRTS